MKNHVIVNFLIVLLGAGPHAFAADSAVVNQANPNIILILVDDMGYSSVGCFGGEIEAANIDRLVKNGLRSTQF